MLKIDVVSNWIEAIPFHMHWNVVGSISIDDSIQFDGEIQMEPLRRSKSISFSIYYRLFAFSANKTKIYACVSGCRRIFSSHTIVIHLIKIYRWKEKTQNPHTHTQIHRNEKSSVIKALIGFIERRKKCQVIAIKRWITDVTHRKWFKYWHIK